MPRLTMLFLRILSMLSRRARRPYVTFRGPGELMYLLDLKRLRILPPLQGADGADDDDDDEGGAEEESEEDETEDESESDSEEDDEEDGTEDETSEDDLPDKVKAILKKERKARRDAERKLREATKKPKAPPKKPSKKEDSEPDDEVKGPDTGTVKLRSANLLIALGVKGYEGQRAKVVAKLLDDIEFGDDDEPVDLDGALEDAEERWGTEMFVKGDKKPKPKAPSTGGKDKGDDDDDAKPRLTSDELAMAKSFGMTPKEYAAYKVGVPKPPKAKKKK